jgi:hypothetical protein
MTDDSELRHRIGALVAEERELRPPARSRTTWAEVAPLWKKTRRFFPGPQLGRKAPGTREK